jgi:hypothetical protein
LPPGYTDLKNLGEAVMRLNLPPIKPDMAKFSQKTRFFTPLSAESLFPAMGEIVSTEGDDIINNKDIKYTLGILEEAGFLPPKEFNNRAEISAALAAVKVPPFMEWRDQKLAKMCFILGNSFLKNYWRAHKDEDELKSPKFWEIFMVGMEPLPDIHTTDTLGLLQALRELGIEYGKPIPELTGLNAIRYACLEQQMGFTDANFRKEPLTFDPNNHRKAQRNMLQATDSKILQAYDDAMQEEIRMRHIKKHLVMAAKEDLAISRKFQDTSNHAHPYAIKRFSRQPEGRQ